jgi:hypothetical protein
MTFPSSVEIKPRLQTFFSSRLVIVEVGQSPGTCATVETTGAGAAAEISDVPLFGSPDVTLAMTALDVALAATMVFLFFTIFESV